MGIMHVKIGISLVCIVMLISLSILFVYSKTPLANTATTPPLSSYDNSILSSINILVKPTFKKITVKVSNGIVYLSGEVYSPAEYEQLIALVESTAGVANVDVENLTIKNYTLPVNDLLLTSKVKGALLQSRLLGANLKDWPITIYAKDGEVFLSGKVLNIEKKTAILELVKTITGVDKVNDNIGISGS